MNNVFTPYGDTAGLYGGHYVFAERLAEHFDLEGFKDLPDFIEVIKIPSNKNLKKYLQEEFPDFIYFPFEGECFAISSNQKTFHPSRCDVKVESWLFYREEKQAVA